ncbi:UNVERIFIED_CONTAM: hypothetical protein FKN15_046458 [Acipenser sinensis]
MSTSLWNWRLSIHLLSSLIEWQLHTLCPVRALAYYVDRTKSWRQSKQFFVCYGVKSHGQALSKQRLFKWIADRVRTAYELANLPPPESSLPISLGTWNFVGFIPECICQRHLQCSGVGYSPYLYYVLQTYTSFPRHCNTVFIRVADLNDAVPSRAS